MKFAPGDLTILDPSPSPGMRVSGLSISDDDVTLYIDLQRLMPTLTRRQRQVFGSLFLYNMSIEEISEELEINESVVRRHRDEAAKKLEAVRSET